MVEEVGEEEDQVEEACLAPQRRYSLTQAVWEERRDMRFNRCETSRGSPEYLSIVCLSEEKTLAEITDMLLLNFSA